MRKRDLKKKVEELEAEAEERASRVESLPKAYVIGPSSTVYVSAETPYLGTAAVLDKLMDIDASPTSLVVLAQYIPPGADGEASYFAVSGTVST